jgi:hypothetical protein
MFETLEPPEQMVTRRWPLLSYGMCGLAGLLFVVLRVRRHGFSQPVSLAIAGVMLFLSLTWLVTTVRSAASLTNRKVGSRNIILLLLLMAEQVPSMFQ